MTVARRCSTCAHEQEPSTSPACVQCMGRGGSYQHWEPEDIDAHEAEIEYLLAENAALRDELARHRRIERETERAARAAARLAARDPRRTEIVQ